MIPLNFEELQAPVHMIHGWYLTGVNWADEDTRTGWYLHDDGVVRDYCYDDKFTETSGWFETIDDAFVAACAYYTAHGYVYPYALSSDGTIYDLNGTVPSIEDTVHSEVMEFI